MTVTKQLLELFSVDKQLRGLRSRLDQAERFLGLQKTQLGELEAQASTLKGESKKLRAVLHNDEVEAARLEAKITSLRDSMNSSKTSKEYNAISTELGTLKDQKSQIEDRVIAQLTKADESEGKFKSVTAQAQERSKIVERAQADRDAREAEVKDQLNALSAKRAELAKGIPADTMKIFEELVRIRGDEAMSHVEVVDRRAYEYSCGSCMMTLPVESVASITAGKFTRCVSCHCILYTEETDIVKGPTAPKLPSAKTSKSSKPKNGGKQQPAAGPIHLT
jgi:predicted  nucleic acid-binding Zn-ribbon protein